MGEIREKLSRLAKRVGLHLNMPLVKRRKEIRKLVSVPAVSTYTVKPLNKEHLEDIESVLYSEVSLVEAVLCS